MKAIMKGKILKKLKSIRPIGYLKQDRILQAYAVSDGYVQSHSENQSPKLMWMSEQISPLLKSSKEQKFKSKLSKKKMKKKKKNNNIDNQCVINFGASS